jgi:DNA-binding MarR family transcriptional regulator
VRAFLRLEICLNDRYWNGVSFCSFAVSDLFTREPKRSNRDFSFGHDPDLSGSTLFSVASGIFIQAPWAPFPPASFSSSPLKEIAKVRPLMNAPSGVYTFVPNRKHVTEEEAAEACLCRKTRMAARAVTRGYDRALRSTGLRITQFTILVAASVAEGVALGQLAEILGLERTTLTRNLALLEKEGLIQIIHQDGRTRNVVIAPAGKARLNSALPLWNRAQEKLQQKLGQEKWSNLQDDLTLLANAG